MKRTPRGWIRLALNAVHAMSYKKKVLLLYGVVVVLPILLFGYAAQKVVLNNLRVDVSRSVYEAVDQVSKNIEFRKQIYELLLNRVSTDGELINRLSVTYTDMVSQWETVRYIDRSFNDVQGYLPGVLDFRIYHNNRTLVEDGGLLWRPNHRVLAGLDEEEWYASMESGAAPMKWQFVINRGGSTYSVSLSRKIFHPLGSNLGVVYLLINNRIFNELMERPFNGRGELYLIDDQGHVLASSRSELQGTVLDEALAEVVRQGEYGLAGMTKTGNMAVARPLSSGWTVIGEVPMAALEEQTRRVSRWIGAMTALLIVFSAVLMWAVANNMVARLRKLGKQMKAIRAGKFNVSVTKETADELGELEEQFNAMSRQLDAMMEQIAHARLREKEADFKQLQAQINPHFLYNTLGMIRWRALDNGDRQLCDIVDLMTTFYRLSLTRSGSVTRIREELDHVRAYLQIQQYRYENRVRIEWDIDESLCDLYTIKLILQPIVENCYMHGQVARKADGMIRLSCQREGDLVVFRIADNGAGMAEEDIRRFARGEHIGKNEGFGLRSIQERLRLYFGHKGLLKLQSAPGQGTVVTITMPICTEQPTMRGEER